jgi:predicted nucleic acid-binding protein
MPNALADTGVWYAMFDRGDEHSSDVADKAAELERCRIVIPWPTFYETLRTRLVRNRPALQRFREYLKRPNLEYLDDTSYREGALELAFSSSLAPRPRPLSMIDCLIRLILDDTGVKTHVLATFDNAHFIDVCRKRGIRMV